MYCLYVLIYSTAIRICNGVFWPASGLTGIFWMALILPLFLGHFFIFVSYNVVPALEGMEVLFCLCYCQQCGGPSSLEEDYDLNDSGHWSNRIPGFKTLRDPEKQRKKEERRRIKEEVSCFFFIMLTFLSIMP